MRKTIRTSVSLLLFASLMGTSVASATGANAASSNAIINPEPVSVTSVRFTETRSPVTAADRSRSYTTSSVDVTYSNGQIKSFPLQYNTIFKSTDVKNGVPAGVIINREGQPIIDTSVKGKETPFVSDGPDANSLIQVPGTAPTELGGNPLSLITHYEYTSLNNAGKSMYGLLPGSIQHTTIDQNKVTGELKATEWKPIDLKSINGVWIPCAGSLSPWNTHLGSEEYEPDARDAASDKPKDARLNSKFKAYFGDQFKPNPYFYGYITEVAVLPNRETVVNKHYSMGRLSMELARVMPDRRTAFLGDDGAYNILPMYVADRENDLSSGTLYAAKWNQTSDKDGGSANLTWIKLGHANDAEIQAMTLRTTFNDIFETAAQDTPGFTKVRVYPTGKDEWLKLKPGMEKAAAFLETHRYAAMLGATTEFNKYEGVAVNKKDKEVYIAIASVDKGMLAETGAPADDIRLSKVKAGAVYKLALNGNQTDTSGNKINSDYVATSVSSLVSGVDLAQPDAMGNTADIQAIANPDNVEYAESLRALLIGEDSGMHLNNYLWAYELDTKRLVRILSVPAGAEVTGLQMVEDLNGFSYIMSNAQHPGDLSDNTTMPKDWKVVLTNQIDAKAGLVGYISGLPTFSKRDLDPTHLISTSEINKYAALKVKYNKKTKVYDVTAKGMKMSFKAGASSVNLNGAKVGLQRVIEVRGNKAYLPAHLIKEAFKLNFYQGKYQIEAETVK